MDKNKYEVVRLRMERCAEALRKNNIYCECVENTEEALDVISTLVNPGDTVAVGGSMTLFESGVIDMLRNGTYNFLDRYESGLTPAQVSDIYMKSFYADAYFMSSNAITEKGELYNVDGNGNRRWTFFLDKINDKRGFLQIEFIRLCSSYLGQCTVSIQKFSANRSDKRHSDRRRHHCRQRDIYRRLFHTYRIRCDKDHGHIRRSRLRKRPYSIQS